MHPLLVTISYKSQTGKPTAFEDLTNENDLFKAQAQALARQNRKPLPHRMQAFAFSLLPHSVQDFLRTRSQERKLRAQIARLDGIAPHLLGDIGVAQVGPDRFELAVEQSHPVELFQRPAPESRNNTAVWERLIASHAIG